MSTTAGGVAGRLHEWRVSHGWRSSPFLLSAMVCVLLAALSAAVLPTVPSYDPWSWIVWGREVFDPHLSFTVSGGPSWKPLPVVFTALYGPLGSAAPTLWVITARAGGLLGLVAAYRLGALVAARGSTARWTPVVSGVLAALGVALTQEWSYDMFRGTSEPMLVAASLWAIDRHIAGRRAEAFIFGIAAGLIRPEAWPFLIAYAIWLWLRSPHLRVLVVLGLLAIPVLWFGPPWVGSGQPFLAASHAKSYNGHLGSSRLLTVLHRGVDLQVLPMLVFALIATGLAWFRRRDRLVLGLAAGAAGWWLLVIAMTLDGYPGLERFYLPAAGVICVLGGAGLVWVAEILAGAVVRGSTARTVAIGACVVLVAVCIPFATSRIDQARAQKPIAGRAVTRLDQLSAAVAAVGGHHGVYPCHSSFAAVNHGVQTALAWKLHVTLGRVGTSMRHPGVMFVGPHDTIDGGPAPISQRLDRIRFVTQVGAWKVYRVWRAGHSTRCVGAQGV